MSASVLSRPTHPSPRSSASNGRYEYNHPTSSLRDPLPGSRSPSSTSIGRGISFPQDDDGHSHDRSQREAEAEAEAEDDFLVHQTKSSRRQRRRKDDNGSGNEHDEDSANPKRRRVTKTGRSAGAGVDVDPSPGKDHGSSTSPSQHSGSMPRPAPLGPPPSRGRGNASTLPSIKPIGFAASREARREDGMDGSAIPSPVVMGFDFKLVDEDQLKTVRDTISIKEQQQALIAARRREANASNPGTPKELTFKGWTPKETGTTAPAPASASTPTSGGVGRRREKTRDKVEKMSIVTSASDKEVVPGSKSAPLGAGLSAQQASPRELPSGSQTALPPHLLPPPGGYHHHNGMSDLRTAPISNARSREEHEFARQQAPYHNLSQARRGYESMQRGGAVHGAGNDRRNFTVPSGEFRRHPAPHPQSASTASAAAGRYEGASHGAGAAGPSGSPSSPHGGENHGRGRERESFIAPFGQLYDLLAQAESLRYSLQDLLHRYEGAYQSQLGAMGEFKNTAAAAGTLLGNLQQSADSLKEMVRYEVERNGRDERRELEELRERVRKLEQGAGAGAGAGGTGSGNGSA